MSPHFIVRGTVYVYDTLLTVRLGIVQAIEKLQKKCVVKFTETEMHIICASDVNEGGILVWSYVDLSRTFLL